jgi:hypothetical protein
MRRGVQRRPRGSGTATSMADNNANGGNESTRSTAGTTTNVPSIVGEGNLIVSEALGVDVV